MSEVTTVALGIEYVGQNYSGWQVQRDPQIKTIQGVLEPALSFVADQPIKVICAGRTDAGVHALGQVISFQTTAVRPLKAWVQGVNCRIPSDVSVAWAKAANNDFHARFSATARRYQYLILNRPTRSAIAGGRFTQYPRPLNAQLMNEAAQFLVGKHDYSSFRGAGCQSKSPVRVISAIKVSREGDVVVLEVKASAFLLHMVRNIVGSLFEVGAGLKSVAWFQEIFALQDRTKAGITARPDGLYLVSVDYPTEFSIPKPKDAAVISNFC